MQKILVFRFRQIGRMIKHAGIGHLLFALLVVFGVLAQVISNVIHSESAGYGLVTVFFMGTLHLGRKDTGFLQQLPINRPLLYSLEYLLLSLPIAIAFAAGGNWGAVGLQTLGMIILAQLPVVHLSKSNWQHHLKLGFVPKRAFELRGLLRQRFLAYVFIYLLGLVLSFWVASALVFAILAGASAAALFDELEGKELFELLHGQGGILWVKTKLYLSLYFTLLLPYIALFLFFHLTYWYLLLAAIFLGMTVIVFNIVYKYAHYAPYRHRVHNDIVNAVFLMATLVPFLYPVTLIYILWYWRKAQQNIKSYYAKHSAT